MRTLLVLLLVCAGVARAGGEHGVSPGPLTALQTFPPAAAQEPLRHVVPEIRIRPQTWTTASGLRVLYWRAPQLPLLDARLVFDAGAARDGDLSGLASAVSHLLDEGTASHDANAIAVGFEQVGATFSTASYRDMALMQLRVASDPAQRDPALNLFAEVAATPIFPADAWLRLQESMRIGQRQRQQSPAGRAGLMFYQRLYGDHPYANPPAGLAPALARMTPDDFRAFHLRFYTAGNAVLVLVGDLDEASARGVADRIGGRLLPGTAAPALPVPAPLTKAVRIQQDFPSQQVHVLIGELGITRDDPDYFPLMVANELLAGGGFGSLLMRELREQRGLTYSVSSSFVPMRARGPFQISFSTRSDQATQALALTQKLLREFSQQGPSADDVSNAVDNLVQAYPRALASNEQIAGYLTMMGFYGLPDDYLARYVGRLQAVTPAQVREALQRHLHPDRQLVITVGPPAGGSR